MRCFDPGFLALGMNDHDMFNFWYFLVVCWLVWVIFVVFYLILTPEEHGREEAGGGKRWRGSALLIV